MRQEWILSFHTPKRIKPTPTLRHAAHYCSVAAELQEGVGPIDAVFGVLAI